MLNLTNVKFQNKILIKTCKSVPDFLPENCQKCNNKLENDKPKLKDFL